MRLLLISPGASYSTADVEAGLRYGLEQHGVQVVRYRLDGRIDRSARWLHYNWRKAKKANPAIEKPNTADVFYTAGIGALEMALRHQVDGVIAVSAMYLHPDVLILMRRAGLRVFVLFTESPYDLAQELEVAKLVTGCWTNERSSVDAFRGVNRHAGYVPHAWHPERHHAGAQPGDEDVPAHDVVFVGSAFPERVDWLSRIDWTGIDLGLYGMWQALRKNDPLRAFVRQGTVDNAVTSALYRRAKIGLNLYRTSVGYGHGEHIAHAESMNPRAYELAACGAFHISTYRDEVREMFGDLVPTVTTPYEASAVIRAWLADEAGRAQVQSELPARVAESSWVQRSTQVIGDIQTLLQSQAA